MVPFGQPTRSSPDSSLSDGLVAAHSSWSEVAADAGAADDFSHQQLFFVTSYSDFDKLAHGPRGSAAGHTLRVYRFLADGALVLLHVAGAAPEVANPAFSRFHPRRNVVYTCTEDVEEHGTILAYEIGPDGSLAETGRVDAGGTSTCFLTLDRDQRHLIAVNYWDSRLAVVPLSAETGALAGPVQSAYDPRHGEAMRAAAKRDGGANHSLNDAATVAQRQADPHSHALVLDPYEGCVAYVPDLGKDLIREFWYDPAEGRIGGEFHALPSGLSTGQPDGPRYLEFHPNPQLNVVFVVNELSSTLAVFSVNRELLFEISRATKLGLPMDEFKGRSTLRLIQSIKTVPKAFPAAMNTCGRICVHQSGRFVIVSNRGHESIAIFRVKQGARDGKGPARGTLAPVGFFHTRGETPRHFAFDGSGQFLVVANQDSDTIAVFSFNLTSGEIRYTGNEYKCPSPNFICSCSMTDRHGDDGAGDASPAAAVPSSVVLDPATTSDAAGLRGELAAARREIAVLRECLSRQQGNAA